jgi:hypothetical protein
MNDEILKDRSLVPIERIERSILLIRGQKVMLDRDLAQLYGVETRALNQAVRRNMDRFPHDFMFPLTREEIMSISHFVISSEHPGLKTLKFSKNVMAFPEHGIAMLSSVLNSKRPLRYACPPEPWRRRVLCSLVHAVLRTRDTVTDTIFTFYAMRYAPSATLSNRRFPCQQ